MLQHRMQHLFLYIPIFCTVGLFGFGGINMDNKYLNEVLERLESYRKKEQQIELLRYELQHAKQVSPTELIEAMTFQTQRIAKPICIRKTCPASLFPTSTLPQS